jgi:hypothetical protein
MRLIDAAQRVSEATDSYDFIYSVTTLSAQLRLYLLSTGGQMSSFIIAISRTIFFRLLAHAPEDLQREAKENARGAIPALCFTEDDIRKKFAQEEQWDGLTQGLQREAVRLLMDADEYARAATFADEAIAEAVGRYLHEAMLEEEERREEGEPA